MLFIVSMVLVSAALNQGFVERRPRLNIAVLVTAAVVVVVLTSVLVEFWSTW